MAQIIPNLIKHLMNDANVTAAFAHRITGDDVPAGQEYPYAYLWEVTPGQQYHMRGEAGRITMVQCDVVDDDILGADTNAEIIRNSLSGFRGSLGDMVVGYVFADTRSVPKDPDQQAYRRIIEINIGTNE
jgi:hypothetical protein